MPNTILPRYFLQLAYKGTNYHGWQRQPNGLTVQEVLENALSTVLRQPIAVVGSGRTDTGVHAAQQFAHFETDVPLPDHLLRSLNGLIPNDVAVYACFPVGDRDHARYTATYRYYQYSIIRRKDPFRDELTCLFTRPLNVAAMNEAAALLPTHTDFQSFSKVNTDVRTFNCRIDFAHWAEHPTGDLTFHIRADRFLRGMVRALVGTLLLVGQDRLTVAGFEQIILARDRKRAGRAAPAEGLSLVEVGYPDAVFQHRRLADT